MRGLILGLALVLAACATPRYVCAPAVTSDGQPVLICEPLPESAEVRE